MNISQTKVNEILMHCYILKLVELLLPEALFSISYLSCHSDLIERQELYDSFSFLIDLFNGEFVYLWDKQEVYHRFTNTLHIECLITYCTCRNSMNCSNGLLAKVSLHVKVRLSLRGTLKAVLPHIPVSVSWHRCYIRHSMHTG